MKDKKVMFWVSIGLLAATAAYYWMQQKRSPVQIRHEDEPKPVHDPKSPIRKYMHKAKVVAAR